MAKALSACYILESIPQFDHLQLSKRTLNWCISFKIIKAQVGCGQELRQ
jgi:hypothetical protein